MTPQGHSCPALPSVDISVGSRSIEELLQRLAQQRFGELAQVDAWRRLHDVGLIHVGSVGDAPLPRELDFKHYSPVEQHHLTGFYVRSHVFGLASRQDGPGTGSGTSACQRAAGRLY